MSHHLKHSIGWRPDLPDARDHLFSPEADGMAGLPLPNSVNLTLSPNNPPIADQGQLGSCTAFGTLRCFDFAEHAETNAFMNGSHLFQYYNTRALEGTTGQ